MKGIGKIIGGGTKLLGQVVGEVTGSNAQARAAVEAANIQAQAAREGQARFEPWFAAGEQALGAQGALTGLQGPFAQAQAIQQLQSSPMFTAMLDQGQQSILSNAAATGGLRGGNVQAALAQFAPMLLAQTIQDQFSRLGGISGMGQNAAGSQSQLMQQAGAAQAGGTLASGSRQANNFNQLLSLLSMGAGFMGGMPGMGARPAPAAPQPPMPGGGGIRIPSGFGW